MYDETFEFNGVSYHPCTDGTGEEIGHGREAREKLNHVTSVFCYTNHGVDVDGVIQRFIDEGYFVEA